VICLLRRFNGKGVHAIAESVQRDERQMHKDFDAIVVEQYQPKPNDIDFLGVIAKPVESTETGDTTPRGESAGSSLHTGRYLMSPRETAAVQEDDTKDV